MQFSLPFRNLIFTGYQIPHHESQMALHTSTYGTGRIRFRNHRYRPWSLASRLISKDLHSDNPRYYFPVQPFGQRRLLR